MYAWNPSWSKRPFWPFCDPDHITSRPYGIGFSVFLNKFTRPLFRRTQAHGQRKCSRSTIRGSTMRVSWGVAAAVLLLGQLESGYALEPTKRLDQYVRSTWTVDRGLPQSTVLGVTQTPD